MQPKQILYISALASETRVNEEYKRTGSNPGFAVQKFSRLLVKGLQANGAQVLAVSNPPNVAGKKVYVPSVRETEDGVQYKYVPYFNLPILKYLCLFIYTFFYVLFWGMKRRKDKAIVCDVLAVSICMGTLFASKINRVKCVAVVTDIYGLMVGNAPQSLIVRLAAKLNDWYSSSFNKYILLTEQMNDVVNPKGRPHIVMEALCDSSLAPETNEKVEKVHPRTVIYAGGLYEKYGLKMLAEGFTKANLEDAKLVYYGSGSYVDEFKTLCKKHSNLEYCGVVPNDVVVAEELKATLLVNPRFTTEKFTKYSFPSKNMEYMASGTPLLTTNLPGMPKEYHPYVFLFKEETVDGYAEAIRSALSYSERELVSFGRKAREFVLLNKNNVGQGKRVLEFIGK
ncbi:glycosyltransferase [Bacteroides thetaiotaomicron]|uniref:glycosyltransferase n=1 Tax=Bacteroides thetaiotaomicron TaxID=818 RepID=UPI001CE29942|nr:glycosyltransferase [Bacteroides thetaiotaomicron]MCA6033436.1 glycosyltransferase [Bacteroides thetaiotaomicron]